MKTLTAATRFTAVSALAFGAFMFCSGFSGDPNAAKAKWNVYVIETGNGEADIHFSADIPTGWKMYSESMAGVDGPLATSIDFDPSSSFKTVGAPDESGTFVKFYENDLGMQVNCLEGKASYVQHVKFCCNNAFSIHCMVNYMLMKDGNIQPPDDEDFVITLEP